MKRSLKILTLVLSLALICGALVVAAFATDDGEIAGIETKLYWDFDNQSEGPIVIAASQHPFTGQPVQGGGYNFYDGQNRQGKIAINSSKDGSGADNMYFFWSCDHNCTGGACTICQTGSFNGYIAAGITPLNYNGYAVDPETGIFSGQYTQDGTYNKFDFVCEADVWAPEGYKFGGAGSTTLKFHTYGVGYQVAEDGKVSLKANWVGDLIPNVKIDTNENGAYIALNHGESSKKPYYVDTNSWAHVTLSVNTVVVDNSYLDVYATLWVNGEYVATEKIGSTDDGMNLGNTGEGTWRLVNGTDFIFGGDWRLQVTNSYAKENDSIAADNMMVRQINREEYKAAGGNLYEVIENKANLSEWDSSLYDRANMPYGYTVAKNTTTDVEYDSLQFALDMASSGDTVELCANVTADVVINEEITLVTTGYTTGKITAGNGLSIYDDGNGEYWTEAGGAVEIYWNACECGLDSCDETHPGDVTTYVGIGGNIFASYEAEGKSLSWTYTDNETLTVYKLTGWMDADGNVYTADSVVTEAIAEEGLLELYPIITSATPVYKYFKGGVETYGFADTISFAEALKAADADTTFVLLDDVLALNWFNGGSGIVPNDGVTIDLNGKTLYWIQDQNSNKSPLFQVSANRTLTVTTSEPGAKILSGKMYVDAPNHSSTQGGPVFVGGGNNATINVDGTKGLEIMSAQLALYDGGNYSTLNITGGTYIQPALAQDSWAVLQMCCFKELNLKDATFITFVSDRNIVGTMGNGAAPTEGSTVNIDGCNFVGGIFNRGDFPELVVNVTNSYIQGKIDLTERFNARSGGRATHGMNGGKWTFGEGCYFGTDVANDPKAAGIKFAEGYKLYSNPTSVEYTYTTNTWKYGNVEESMKFYTDTVTANYSYSIAKEIAPITINWADAEGNSLGTSSSVPGLTATSPAVSVADGWVNASYTAAIPADATDGYTVTVDENTEVVYTAGKVPMYWNYTIVLHFEVNIYYPTNAPEGVTDVKPLNNGSVPTRWATGADIIDGITMNRFNTYPGVTGADNDMNVGLTYQYKGQTINYQAPGVNIGDYAKVIFNGEYTKEMYEAVLAVLNYVNVGNAAANQTTGTEVTEAIALAAEKGIAIENVTIDTERTGNYEALSEYVSGAQIAIGDQGGVQFQLIAKDPSNAAGLKISYLWDSGRQHVKQSWFNKGFWYCHNTWAYCFDDECTIQLTDAEGNVVAECEYSVWDYAAATWDELTDTQKNLIIGTLTWAKYAEAVRV